MADLSFCPKKRKLSKKERKMMYKKGKKSAKTQGIGVMSRQRFTLPSLWKSERQQRETCKVVDYYSPGKTKYRTQGAVREQLRCRNMNMCFDEIEETSSQTSGDSSDEYQPHNESGGSTLVSNKGMEVERLLAVCKSTQITKLVDDINMTSRCSSNGCNGMFN
ncbi:Hypothetical predicted protein [Paramuricea clavata]|uniref:Uncharacterized protein n=1 Tax=Paramuricea clavata TaxID=317549 RepID=A0A6S7G7G9_PARCT|nr:Hypothetical predicted protein [Paramuricea clavata]